MQCHWVIKLQSQTLPNLEDTLGHQDLAHFLWEKNDRSSSAKEQCRTRFPRQFCLPILPCWFREFQIRLSAIPATYRHQLNCWCASISETTALLVRLNAATSSFPLISKSHTCNDSGVDVSNFDKACSAIAAPHLQQNACALFFSSCKQLKTFATLKHKVQVMIFEPSVYTSKQIVQCQSRTDLPIPNNDFPLG